MENPLVPTIQSTGLPSVYDSANFEHYQRCAIALSSSQLVPTIYQGKAGIPNCLIALEISLRVGMPAFMVMQNMDVLHGRPAWRSQFKIALVNSNSRFNKLEFEFETRQGKTVDYVVWEGVKPNRRKIDKKHVLKENTACRAYTTDKTGKVVHGPWITLELAIKEGWYFRDGSKWETMPEKMLSYRAGSWFADLYIPEASMGMKTDEEVLDIAYTDSVDVTPAPPRNAASRLEKLNAEAEALPATAKTDVSATPDKGKKKEDVKTAENAPTEPEPVTDDFEESETAEEGFVDDDDENNGNNGNDDEEDFVID